MPGTVFDGESATLCFRLLSSAASDNAQNAVGRPCKMTGVQGSNAKAAPVYIKLYDKLASPLSTDTPVKTLYLPASTTFSIEFPQGFVFQNGLGIRMTTGVADNDATAVATGDILALNIDYT